MAGRYRIAVDIGGTFSDFVILDETTGEASILKVPSTPRDPSLAVLDGVARLAARGVSPTDVSFFSHGTTVATNTLLEEKGAKTGLLITEGFRGIYEVQDQTRGYGPATYDLFFQRPALLARPRDTAEVPERVDYQGNVLRPLDEAAAAAGVRRLRDQGIESLAVCLLFSFMHPAHELRLAALIRQEHPSCAVSLSSEILPQIREYYRLSTTVINAYVAPRLAQYLASMEARLRGSGIGTRQLFVMQSNGGVTTFGSAAARAVTTILSGPAAGVIAGAALAAAAGYDKVITFDMGGTSADIALVERGAAPETTRGQIGGRDIAVPMLDINTISAGGGTLAWVDEVGVLQVGPQSAGADPGPVCYGKGGAQPTVTDANLALGYLNPDYFLGGEVPLDRAAAERAIAERIAAPLGLEPLRAASGIVEIINVHMEQGIKAVSSERGHDLREFALVAFGGAGAVHAGRLAADLDIPRVVVPEHPGVTSALGLLMSDVKHDYVRSRLRPLADTPPDEANAVLAELAERARADLRGEGFADEQVALQYLLDLRYSGQGYELSVAAPAYPLGAAGLAEVRRRFDALHERLHGHQAPEEPVEVVNYRVVAFAHVPQVQLQRHPPATTDVAAARKGERLAAFAEYPAPVACPVYDRRLLGPGHVVAGPAIVEQVDSTIVVYPGQEAVVDDYRNVIIHVAPTA
ncbi:MAG TPA: hydantoinase/oxoprolinase family protein [Chloroflexota bacterium]|nr:hydantoinase/oxoprolinase family protein [Chloroflexota bacterium]